MHKVIERSQNK